MVTVMESEPVATGNNDGAVRDADEAATSLGV